MAKADKIDVLTRVARSSTLGDRRPPFSILSLAAAAYGARPLEDATVPTGFDPFAIALFEAIVEGAYLVASADGVFDDEERKTFERVVAVACGGAVAARQISALVGDLETQLREDGLAARVRAVGRHVHRQEHAREVLRIAALLATVSEDVSEVERSVLVDLAASLKLAPGEVDAALADVQRAVATAR